MFYTSAIVAILNPFASMTKTAAIRITDPALFIRREIEFSTISLSPNLAVSENALNAAIHQYVAISAMVKTFVTTFVTASVK